jgi:hypothetical protein
VVGSIDDIAKHDHTLLVLVSHAWLLDQLILCCSGAHWQLTSRKTEIFVFRTHLGIAEMH